MKLANHIAIVEHSYGCRGLTNTSFGARLNKRRPKTDEPVITAKADDPAI